MKDTVQKKESNKPKSSTETKILTTTQSEDSELATTIKERLKLKIDKVLLDKVAKALSNIERNVEYYFDIDNGTVCNKYKNGYVKIEPALRDIIDFMEDFALEQDAEDVQENLLNGIRCKDEIQAVKNFTHIVKNFSRSQKLWDKAYSDFLRQMAAEFLSDLNS